MSDRTGRVSRHFIRPCLVASLLLGLIAPAAGQSAEDRENIDAPGLDIEAVAGIDSRVDRSTPIPISLLMSNHSDTSIEGEIWITDPWQSRETRIGEVYLSEGSSRRLNSIQDLRQWNECYVELRVNKVAIWRKSLPINTGNEFIPDIRYALIINNSTRHLDLPKTVNTPVITKTPNVTRRYRFGQQRRPDTEVSASRSQTIDSLNCKIWQLPNHPAPLMVASAIIFPNGIITDDLNAAQWRAIAEWTCRGGVVFIHDKSDEIVDQLLKSVPLNYEPAIQKDGYSTVSVGLGSIHEYAGPVFDKDTLKTEQKIAETISKHTKHSLPELIQLTDLYFRESGRADRTRSLIMAFFGIYTLLSGIVSIVFFRRGRRGITVYIGSLVGIACICSALLGGSLRYSRGDVHWVSVTQAGSGGSVQYAKLSLQSAGSRNSRMAIKGENLDLQQISAPQYYYSSNGNDRRYPPMTRQPNAFVGDDSTFQLNVPITPWGRRELHATAYNREFDRIDVDLKIAKSTEATSAQEYRFNITNTLPFDLQDARVYITSTSGISTRVQSEGEAESEARTPDQLVATESYRMMGLGSIPADDSLNTTFAASDATDRTRIFRSDFAGGTLTVPSVSQIEVMNFWIVAELKKSPCLAIDTSNSDFTSAEELHFFVQKIRPQEIQQVED